MITKDKIAIQKLPAEGGKLRIVGNIKITAMIELDAEDIDLFQADEEIQVLEEGIRQKIMDHIYGNLALELTLIVSELLRIVPPTISTYPKFTEIVNKLKALVGMMRGRS